MLERLDFAGNYYRLLDEVMILPMTIIDLLAQLAYNWRTFSSVCFFFQSVISIDYKQYTNSIRDLIVITVFFSHCVLICIKSL